MTYARMRDLVWAGLGTDSHEETDLVNAATIYYWFNAWEYEIIKKVMTLPRDKWKDHLDGLIDRATITGNGTTQAWNLPATMIAGGDTRVKVGSYDAIRREPSYQRVSDINTLYTAGVNDPMYYIFDGQIHFLTAPASGATVYLYYLSQPAGTSGATSELPAKWHQTGVWYALAQAFMIDGDNVQVAEMNKKFEAESEALLV